MSDVLAQSHLVLQVLKCESGDEQLWSIVCSQNTIVPVLMTSGANSAALPGGCCVRVRGHDGAREKRAGKPQAGPLSKYSICTSLALQSPEYGMARRFWRQAAR